MEPEADQAEAEAGMTLAEPGETGLAGSAAYDVEVPGSKRPVRVEEVDAIEVLRGGELVLVGSDGGWLAVFANGEWRRAIALDRGEAGHA